MTEKRRTHREALFDLLGDGAAHSMAECLRVGGYRYGGRLHELRREGHVIETIRTGDDTFSYRLLPVVANNGEQLAMTL